MSNDIYIARQPILDTDQHIFGYELLFRSQQQDGSVVPLFDDNLLATTRVLVNTLNHIGINNLVGHGKAFVNVDKEMLMDNMILNIPKERFIIELLETIEVTDKLVQRIQDLKELGYRFALDDANCDPDFLKNFLPVFPHIDVLKLDIQALDIESLKANLSQFKSYDFKLLAEKVETEEEFEQYKALGCDLFQGYFFARPKIISQEAMDPHYKKIFNLIKLLDMDLDLDELSHEFESQADITLQLLRFMNSGQLHLKSEIKSIKHALSLLGKVPLKQWLLLIAYSKTEHSNSASVNSPLFEMASSRSKLMFELMDVLHHNNKRSHEAAFVGLLSLMHAIVHVPIDEILNELHVDTEIYQAITHHAGELGLLLDLVVAVEAFHMQDAHNIIQKLKISEHDFKDALLQSMRTHQE